MLKIPEGTSQVELLISAGHSCGYPPFFQLSPCRKFWPPSRTISLKEFPSCLGDVKNISRWKPTVPYIVWLVVRVPTPLKSHGVKVSWDEIPFPFLNGKSNPTPWFQSPAYSYDILFIMAIWLYICWYIYIYIIIYMYIQIPDKSLINPW